MVFDVCAGRQPVWRPRKGGTPCSRCTPVSPEQSHSETSKLVQVFTLFLRFPRESFPSWPTAPALVSSGLPGGSEEQENLQFDLPQYKQAFDRGMDEEVDIAK